MKKKIKVSTTFQSTGIG